MIRNMFYRIVKQFIYGFFYLVIFGSIIIGVYFFLFRPVPDECLDIKNKEICAIKNLASLKVLPIQFFPVQDMTTALVKISNNNLDYAAKSFSYRFNLYDNAGVKIFTLTGQSFIYAADMVGFVLPALEVPFAKVARSEFIITKVDWISKDLFSKPEVMIQNIITKVDKNILVIDADFINKNLYDLSRVNIGVLATLDNGLPIGASRTILESISSLGLKHFKVFVPASGLSLHKFSL